MRDLEAIARDAVDAGLLLHREIGPGLLESVYESLLAAEMSRRGYRVVRQHAADFTFNGMFFKGAFKSIF